MTPYHFPTSAQTRRTLLIFLLTALVLASASAQTEKDTTTQKSVVGRVTGRVVYADNGHPVRRVRVQLTCHIPSALKNADVPVMQPLEKPKLLAVEPKLTIISVPEKTVITDLNGAFTAELTTTEEDFARFRCSAWAVAKNLVSYNTPSPPNAVSFTLRADAVTQIEIAAQRGGVITGRVRYPNDAPVSQAMLQLFQRDADKELQEVELTNGSELQADRYGVYRIAGLPAGEYLLAAHEPDISVDNEHDEKTAYSTGRLVAAFHPAARHADQAKLIKVELGRETTETDITLPDKVYHIGGSVLFDGAPVAQATVNVSLQNGLSDFTWPKQTRTDAQGAWHLNGLPDGKYKLTVAPPDAADLDESSENATTTRDGQRNRFANALNWTAEFALDADRADWRITLPTGGRLLGVLAWFDKRPPEQLAEDFTGSLIRLDNLPTAEPDVYELHNKPYGAFEISGLPTGLYAFVSQYENALAYLKSVLVKGQDVTAQPLQITLGQDLTDVRLVFADDFATVSGHAYTDATYKTALAASSVKFVATDRTRRALQPYEKFQDTDEKGEFSVKLPPGEYYVVALGDDDAFDLADYQKNLAKLARITVTANAKITGFKAIKVHR